MENQRGKYPNAQVSPYFPVIQSSGYGKSRMITNLKLKNSPEYRILYWSFGSKETYPACNISLPTDVFKDKIRSELQSHLEHAIAQFILKEDVQSPYFIGGNLVPTDTLIVQKDAIRERLNDDDKKTLFVVDEASWLLEHHTSDGMSYFRALRSVMKKYGLFYDKLFFVVMATFSHVANLSPGLLFDHPSFKPVSGSNDKYEGPLDPFILGSSYRVLNDKRKLLAKSVEECHKLTVMLSMGRPLWNALLTAKTNAMTTDLLLDYAERKLLAGSQIESLSSEQVLALLAPIICLSISPMSVYTHSLVAQHMATALDVSDDRLRLVVAYPSEPVLAVAAMRFIVRNDCWSQLVAGLQQLLAHGAVDKGYKGEIIVRILNLLAMTAARKRQEANETYETSAVTLREFLTEFNREEAPIDQQFFESLRSGTSLDDRIKILKRLKLWDSFSERVYAAKKEEGTVQLAYLDGTVCFTHFIYLAKKTPITHDLLRYAYRRGAAIVVEAGWRGIDWLIPLRIGADMFVALVGQDKNRVADSLVALTAVGTEETSWKINAKYFLNDEEQKSFTIAGVALEKHWPAILFAVGIDEVGAAAAHSVAGKETRAGSPDGALQSEGSQFPCLVLTGLDYQFLDDGSNEVLKQLRFFEIEVQERKKMDIPITYGF